MNDRKQDEQIKITNKRMTYIHVHIQEARANTFLLRIQSINTKVRDLWARSLKNTVT